MGLIDRLFSVVFGGGRNVIAETAEVFRVSADKSDARAFSVQTAAMGQYGAEFRHARQGWFDRLVDGINRIPRPAMALGTLGLLVAAMVDPVWFASRMQGIALVPEPLWWLLGAIVSFYFGARHQAKGQDFQRSIVQTMSHVPDVVGNIDSLQKLSAKTPGVAKTEPDAAVTLSAINPVGNAALADWKRRRTS